MAANESNDDRTESLVALSAGTKLSHYRLLKKIGAGGMGEVWLAEDTKLDRSVALKFIPAQYASDSAFKARFTREAQAAAKLNHPNIITVHEVGEHHGRPFFAMELVEGQSLREYAAAKELDVERVINLAIQICDALSVAHEKKVIHRDIKPSNIIIDAYGRPKIVDFGLAAVQGAEQLTKTGSTLGTVGYMSPEQVRGGEIDHRSDLFSLGVVLYQLITRQSPFKRDNDTATGQAIVNDTPEPLARYRANIPDGIQAIISKLLEKDPALRYQVAAGVISDLRRLRRRSSDDDRGLSRAGLRRRLSPAMLFITAAVVVVVAVGGYLLKDLLTGPTGSRSASGGTQWSNSIAVLPFRDFSSKQDQEPFCDGMTDAIIGKLSGISGLKVISMTSVMQYKSPDRDLRKIGQELRVTNILEGSIQRENGAIRVQTQLIHAADDAHLWSSTYDRELASVFAIQDDISRSIVDAMKLRLLGKEETSLAKRATDNAEAYNAYVQGRYFWRKRTEEALMKAVEHFEKAIELDPEYALAYSGLADAWSVLPGYSSVSTEEADPKAKQAAERALALDDQLAEAHASMGLVLYDSEENEKSEKEYLRAIELNPGYVWTHTWYANLLDRMGRPDENLERLQIAYELDPLNIVTLTNLANKKRDARKWDEAESLYRQVLELETLPFVAVRLGELLVMIGHRQEAIDLYERTIEQFPRNERLHTNLWYLYAYTGNLDAALQTVERLHEQRQDDTGRFLWRGDVFGTASKYDQAIESYERALELKPESEEALNSLVWTCGGAGRFEDAVKYANKLVGLKPKEPWSYQLRSYANAVRGALDKVIEDSEKSRELDPDNLDSYWMEAIARLYLADWDGVKDIIREKYLKSDNVNYQTNGVYLMARLLAVQGQFDQALAYTDSCLAADSLDDRLWYMAFGHQLRMYIYEEMDDLEQAVREGRRVVELYKAANPGEMIAWQDYLAKILADYGEFDEAEEIADNLKTTAESAGLSYANFGYYYVQGAIEFARGNYEAAIEPLKTSADSTSDRLDRNYFQAPLLLARAYFEAGKTDQAIAEYETILSNKSNGRLDWVVQITKARYHLARAYEQAGRIDDAITQYDDFLKRWGEADVRLESVKDARARLARLKGET
ncbi:MAG: protein kinase [Candidatus Zixiibacteriota bacterium]|nr:MAG: protein kinase [candidate division Zixibacteria bacterium]